MTTTTRTRRAIAAAAIAAAALASAATAGAILGTTVNVNITRPATPTIEVVNCGAAVDDTPGVLVNGTTTQIDTIISRCDHRRDPAARCAEDAWCAIAEVNDTGDFRPYPPSTR